jgi:hypothetical protein
MFDRGFTWNYAGKNYRYWQNINFVLFAKCLKMCLFVKFAFKICNECCYDPDNFFLNKQYVYKKAKFFSD